MQKKSSLVLSVLVLLGLLWPASVSAATLKGLVVSPALQEVTLEKDKPDVSFPFKVTNTTANPMSLQLSVLDFGALNESGGLAFVGRGGQETTTYGLKQWMTLEKESLSLAPGESQTVQTTVANRDSLAPGGHYGAVVITSQQDADKGGQSVAVLPSASVLVLLKKTGGEVLKLNLLSATPYRSVISLPKTVDLRFQNVGNTHAVPRGTVKIQDPLHHVIGRATINENSSYVLPEAYRVIPTTFTSAPKGWLPGRYTITTTWRYDGTTKTNITVTRVWYIGLIPIVFISLTVFGICIFFVQRRLSRKKTPRT